MMAIFPRDCTTKAEWLIVTPLGLPVVPTIKKQSRQNQNLKGRFFCELRPFTET